MRKWQLPAFFVLVGVFLVLLIQGTFQIWRRPEAPPPVVERRTESKTEVRAPKLEERVDAKREVRSDGSIVVSRP